MRDGRSKALTLGLAALFAAALVPRGALAQSPYPARPVRLVVPFLAGGAIDLVARLVTENMAGRMGQPFVIDIRAGAGGTIGADAVAKAAPDGHTLLFTVQAPLTITPFVIKQMPYDAENAFAMISIVAEAPNVLLVHPGIAFRTVKQFIEYAKAHPGMLTYASQGPGTTGHITGAMLNQQAGISLVHVPYKGFPPMFTDVKTGRVAMMIADTINALPRIHSKELIPIAIAAEKRSGMLPEVPTFAENGYPGVVSGPWFALAAPAGTPIELRRLLADEARTALANPTVAQRLRDLGVDLRGTTPEEADAWTKSEYKRWRDAIRAAGIKPE